MPVALVTGAGIRVGRAIALALADAGFDLILHYHSSRDAVMTLAKKLRAKKRMVQLIRADLSEQEGVRALATEVIAQHQILDILVNNAAAYECLAFSDLTYASYQKMMALNIEAPLFLTQSLLPLLYQGASPCVINVTDSAVFKPYARHAHYLMSKAALDMLTKALAIELAPRIRVNSVAPGTVAFPESFGALKQERIVKRIPLERVGSPADIGKAVVFLSRDAPYITGQTVVVDGGALLN